MPAQSGNSVQCGKAHGAPRGARRPRAYFLLVPLPLLPLDSLLPLRPLLISTFARLPEVVLTRLPLPPLPALPLVPPVLTFKRPIGPEPIGPDVLPETLSSRRGARCCQRSRSCRAISCLCRSHGGRHRRGCGGGRDARKRAEVGLETLSVRRGNGPRLRQRVRTSSLDRLKGTDAHRRAEDTPVQFQVSLKWISIVLRRLSDGARMRGCSVSRRLARIRRAT
jgi:hypothetical protein